MKDELAAYGLPTEEARGDGLCTARVVSQQRGQYRIVTAQGETAATVSGRLRHEALSPSDYPAVGDYVLADTGTGGDAVIRSVLPRKSCFVRRAAGDTHQEQVVASNVDTVFLCMSLNRDFSLRRLERDLAAAWESGAGPVVVLTKADLCADARRYALEAERVAVGVTVLVTTSLEAEGLSALSPYLRPGRTVAFIGSSGVGKSTMINRLLGVERQATGGLRGDARGRHTTTGRELLPLEGGALLLDTPGMREMGMWDAQSGIDQTFSDILELASQCRFTDCTHTAEPGCAVRRAVERGELDAKRLAAFMRLSAENAYAQDSAGYLAQKEKKFREISRINKAARKNGRS